MIPEIETIATNFTALYMNAQDKPLKIFYSYKTPVAYALNGNRVCSQNEWSTTTGKNLNQIEPDHKKRLPHDQVCRQLEEILQ